MKKLVLIVVMIFGVYFTQAQSQLSDKDKKFIQEAAQGSLIEIKLGELAQTKAVSTEVKTLGQHMVTDHSKANTELKALADKKGVTVSTTLNEKKQKMYDDLSKKQGKDFDKAYSKCMVKDHKKEICKFKKVAKKGDDSELKSWASNTLPTLEHHKEMAEQTCKSIKNK